MSPRQSPGAAAAASGPLAGGGGAGFEKEKSLLPANFVMRVLDLNYGRAFMMSLCVSKMNWGYSPSLNV